MLVEVLKQMASETADKKHKEQYVKYANVLPKEIAAFVADMNAVGKEPDDKKYKTLLEVLGKKTKEAWLSQTWLGYVGSMTPTGAVSFYRHVQSIMQENGETKGVPVVKFPGLTKFLVEGDVKGFYSDIEKGIKAIDKTLKTAVEKDEHSIKFSCERVKKELEELRDKMDSVLVAQMAAKETVDQIAKERPKWKDALRITGYVMTLGLYAIIEHRHFPTRALKQEVANYAKAQMTAYAKTPDATAEGLEKISDALTKAQMQIETGNDKSTKASLQVRSGNNVNMYLQSAKMTIDAAVQGDTRAKWVGSPSDKDYVRAKSRTEVLSRFKDEGAKTARQAAGHEKAPKPPKTTKTPKLTGGSKS